MSFVTMCKEMAGTYSPFLSTSLWQIKFNRIKCNTKQIFTGGNHEWPKLAECWEMEIFRCWDRPVVHDDHRWDDVTEHKGCEKARAVKQEMSALKRAATSQARTAVLVHKDCQRVCQLHIASPRLPATCDRRPEKVGNRSKRWELLSHELLR